MRNQPGLLQTHLFAIRLHFNALYYLSYLLRISTEVIFSLARQWDPVYEIEPVHGSFEFG